MCKNPCDEMKWAVCQHEKQCEGPFFMPCGDSCFEFRDHWPNRDKTKDYVISACEGCTKNSESNHEA